MQKLIEFKNMEVKQIEFKPLIFRLYKINYNWNKDFDNTYIETKSNYITFKNKYELDQNIYHANRIIDLK